ncbi:MAG: hypothetical protein GXY83_42300 [Rhodopirellula sp.]|nr:hypothetical protein [Rhodopirellula sp.]
MTKKSNRNRIFLETSGVIYVLHGDRLMRTAVANATGNGHVKVSNFIRMEYLRGVILNLIEFYFLLKDSDSVADACIAWSQKVKQERKLKVVLMTIHRWMVDQEGWNVKERSLRRLGDEIVRMVCTFDDQFTGRTRDHLGCELGRVFFPRRAFDDEMLLRFYDRFTTIQKGVPNCYLCGFKAKQQRSLLAQKIDICSEQQQKKYRKYPGYIQQAERVGEVEATKETVPRCRWCERLGDTIIGLQSPKKAALVTADRAFVPLGEILKKDVRLLPSLAALKKQASAQNGAEDTG